MEVSIRTEIFQFWNLTRPLSIIHLSDLHIAFSNKRLLFLEEFLDTIQPDLILMTGDYFDTPIGAYHIRKFIQSIALRYIVVYISGNHDHYYGKKVFNKIAKVEAAHFIDFSNFFYKKGHIKLNIVSKITLNQRVKDVPTIVLLHDPQDIEYLDTKFIDIALAGHLHGGQFVLYKDKSGFFYPGHFLYRYCTDKLMLQETTLLVNRGLGDTFPFRYNCPKEIIHLLIY